MRVAILGAAGQLGRDLCAELGSAAVALTRAEADLTRPETVRRALEALRPAAVANCAAYNLVDRAETEPAAAFAVNALGVRELAVICRDLDCVLLHFSTDYVFGLDESRRTPCTEDEAPGPVNVYGVSKAAGESLVRLTCPRHLVVRTCGLYGRHGVGGKGGNFVETMLRKAAEGAALRVVADQVCTPTATADLARLSAALLRAGHVGLYHLTATGACSWHEFAAAIFELAGVRADLTPVPSAAYAAPARRPRWSVLSGAKYDALGLAPRRSWRAMLADYLNDRGARPGARAPGSC